MSFTVLIASYLEPEQVERIRQTLPGLRVLYDPELLYKPRYQADHIGPSDWSRTPEQEKKFLSWLAEADIMWDFDRRLTPRLTELAPRLKWIQATSSGIGDIVKKFGLDQSSITITNAAGIHAIPLAEHSLLSMLYFTKNVPFIRKEQAAHHWERYCSKELRGSTLGVVGLGAVGREVARLAKANGLKVLGVKRNVDMDPASLNVDELYPQSSLSMVLPRCDFLVLICPHTPETEGMIGERELALLPKGAVLINIARGAVVDEDALIASLQSGHLAGAALDVARTEPLPADSPLWSMENVLITPHSASTVTQENQRLTDLFCENLQRFSEERQLLNLFKA
ncbi:D-2-hydroxyacid dehydrogenase [Paenibacillus sp. GP183]|uniref:D-2-hydroxyacid dehydrogenase n=1 Tax=Paenibacillus sp. GP183 TaxID=1882751 RepID=UPI00089A402B|nr:D-2-hydroxyacid dehydrogenase [Paenibacillus sp. GP183]SEB84639.1 Phosphoglycerate dehydrogenase [Paenibacillus sp. GP183]